MKGLAFLGLNKIGVIDKPIPEPGPDEIVIRTTAALICTTDVHSVRGVMPLTERCILGHESVGVVHSVGSSVKRFRKGERVTSCALTPCGRCDACQRGHMTQCGGIVGGYKFTVQRDGNLAEYYIVNDADFNVVHIPDVVSDEQALYTTDMMGTGFAAVEAGNVPMGGSVAVFAQGPVGLCATAGARIMGAGLVIAVESKPNRQELARKFGADAVVDPEKEDAVAAVLKLTDGIGVDCAVEALGHPVTFENCIRTTRPGGVISNVGYHGEAGDHLTIPLPEFGYGMSDKIIRSVLCPGGRERMQRLLRMIANKRFDPTPMTTHRLPFSQVEKAFRMMESKEDNIIKPLVTFD